MIKLEKITKKYGNRPVFSNFDFLAEDNKITVVLGESGAGKTTLLNIIARLTDFDGTVSGVEDVSMVFQRDRLVPVLTVEKNVKLVNENADVASYLKEFELNGIENAYPHQLSAGMARRVAIIRAFASTAPVVLMDEPLVNLDLSLKYLLIGKIKELKDKYGKTVVLVTHDTREAAMLADKIVVIKNGATVYETSSVSCDTEAELIDVLLNKKEKKDA